MAPAATRRKVSSRGNDDQAVSLDTRQLPHLPDLLIEKILGLLPTKLAVRSSLVSKQWGHIWSLQVPALDFDDEYDQVNLCDTNHHGLDRRTKLFIEYLENCLKQYRRCQRENASLDKFRLRVASYASGLIDPTHHVNAWLNFAVENSVKDLDISLSHHGVEAKKYYCIPAPTLLNAKLLTSLNLEYVNLGSFTNSEIFFPALKTMSLKAVVLKNTDSLNSLILGCTSIDYLSLTSCSFSSIIIFDGPISFQSSSLKFVHIENCEFPSLRIRDAANLESFTVLETSPLTSNISLDGCHNLKDINISAQSLNSLSFNEIHCVMKARIDTPNLRDLFLWDLGWLNEPHVFSMKAPNLTRAQIDFRYDEDRLGISHWPFPILRDFLANFDCFGTLIIGHDDAQALVFPEDLMNTYAPPLPRVEGIEVLIAKAHKAIQSDLERSLQWMAPSANICTCKM